MVDLLKPTPILKPDGGGVGTITVGTTQISGATQGSVFFAGASGVIQQDNANLFWDDTNNRLGIGTASPSARLHIVQAALSAASPTGLLFVGGAHTALTASTEATDVNFNLARTVQFATGTITLQRAFRIQGPTYAGVGAMTITTATTLEVDGPIAGTNVTFTEVRAAIFNSTIEINRSDAATQIYLAGGSGSIASITATKNDTGIVLQGNRSAASGGNDVYVRTTAGRTAGTLFTVQNGSTSKFSVGYQGQIALTPAAVSSGAVSMFTLTNANHTGQTASTEIINFNLTAYTRTWATGAITLQREFYIGAATYAFAGASTITTAITLDVDAPVAGTNASITNNRAIRANGVVEVVTSVASAILLSGGNSGVVGLDATAASTMLRLRGNKNAGTGLFSAPDVSAESQLTRTTGYIFGVSNNSTMKLGVTYRGAVLAAGDAAIPAGGTQDLGYMFSSTASFGVFFGSGAPTLSAAKGSLYLRSDGSTTNDRAYINTDGGTTWSALTTAA